MEAEAVVGEKKCGGEFEGDGCWGGKEMAVWGGVRGFLLQTSILCLKQETEV
ncbi:hypothetical protein Syun_022915 [Stephania yunnanensis]|uniref:Uncharacterized protein n=1 Tax=Stephania yunnanensis TaxID=152371 RepID=A0AAP0I3H2_9MAGN